MDKVELMDEGKVIEEVEKKEKTRGGAAAGRGRGQGRKGNSRKEAMENEGVDENDMNLMMGIYKRMECKFKLSTTTRGNVIGESTDEGTAKEENLLESILASYISKDELLFRRAFLEASSGNYACHKLLQIWNRPFHIGNAFLYFLLTDKDEHENSLKKQCIAKTSTSASKKPKPNTKDPQSIAAKNPRERISKRLKVLQELVPNGSKEKDTDKIFYGLDDIEGENEIIIVSVPDGAPASVNPKDLPPHTQASRIILAIDGDAAGQALAEELARRLGKERCWRVKWPKKNDDEHCKDANEKFVQPTPLERGRMGNEEQKQISRLTNVSLIGS
ncbi:hypothetical protein ACFE04_000202 [Oxalis oulophora]